MPFQDDSGINPDERRNPLVGTFAAFAGQIERVVVLNVAWSIHLLPALFVFANPDLSNVVRSIAIIYTAIALVPATGFLFGMVRHVIAHELINLEIANAEFRRLALPSFTVLLPLYLLFVVLAFLVQIAADANLVLFDTLLRLIALLLLLCATYWGALFADDPNQSAWQIARRSAVLTWQAPLPTLLVTGAVLLVVFISTISVGGLFLVAPVLVALLQTEMWLYLRVKHSRV